MNISEIPHVASIALVCSLIGQIIKQTKIKNKWIPIIIGISGALLGVLAHFFMPGFPSSDIIGSIAIGIVSSTASTWAHQIGKQINKDT